jgi:hypothetical protein
MTRYATAHGKSWPLEEREAFRVEILGTVLPESAASLKTELLAIENRYGLASRVYPVTVVKLKDRAEKEAMEAVNAAR